MKRTKDERNSHFKWMGKKEIYKTLYIPVCKSKVRLLISSILFVDVFLVRALHTDVRASATNLRCL